ncbi:acetylxylan esterase, partial [Bacillus sp. SIMBA_074]
LLAFRPEVQEPADFDAFWERTIAEARAAGGTPELTPADTPVTQLIVEDLVFPGFGGEPVRAWVSRPLNADGPLPAVVQFQGYGGGRGIA